MLPRHLDLKDPFVAEPSQQHRRRHCRGRGRRARDRCRRCRRRRCRRGGLETELLRTVAAQFRPSISGWSGSASLS